MLELSIISMNALTSAETSKTAKKFEVYVTVPEDEGKAQEIIDEVVDAAKKIFWDNYSSGATVNPKGQGIYVSKKEEVGEIKEAKDYVHKIEIITGVSDASLRIKKLCYYVLAVLDFHGKIEEAILCTEQEATTHLIDNPDYKEE